MPPFAASYKGQDIFSIRVPRSGISYSSLLEWLLAARWAGYTLESFFELEGQMQSFYVAAYRTAHQIDAVLAHEQAKEARRANRQQGLGRKKG